MRSRRSFILFEQSVKFFISILVLEGAEDSIFRVGIGSGDKGFKGAVGKPGVLVQEVDVVIAFFQGVFKAKVVGLGKAKVLCAADKFHLRKMPLDIIGTAVSGVIVHHKDVGTFHGAKAAVQPLHSVVGDYYYQYAVHTKSFL